MPVKIIYIYVCVCVCVRARAGACVCVCVCVIAILQFRSFFSESACIGVSLVYNIVPMLASLLSHCLLVQHGAEPTGI